MSVGSMNTIYYSSTYGGKDTYRIKGPFPTDLRELEGKTI